jgi:acyl carrier protein
MNTKDILRSVFSEVLGTTELSETENIFDIGGDSIAIYKISELLKEKHDIELKPIDIMMYPTIEKLTDFIASGGNTDNAYTGEVVVKRRARRRSDD